MRSGDDDSFVDPFSRSFPQIGHFFVSSFELLKIKEKNL